MLAEVVAVQSSSSSWISSWIRLQYWRVKSDTANYIIIDIIDILRKPPFLSCNFDIIFVFEYVLVFDECHS